MRGKAVITVPSTRVMVCLISCSRLSFAIGASLSPRAAMIGFRRSESNTAIDSESEPREARGTSVFSAPF